jgi:hypothetical protein
MTLRDVQTIGPGGDTARVSVFSVDPGSGNWDSATWDGNAWSMAGWQAVECQVLSALYRWGASTEAGVLTKAEAGSLDLELADPGRLLDPLNVSSPLWGAMRPGTPLRLEGVIDENGSTWPAAFGYIDTAEHDLAGGTGRIRAVDGIAYLAMAQFPPGVQPVANTLRARVRDIVSRAGMAGLVPCEDESAFAGVADPPVTPRPDDKGPEGIWQMISDAAEDALWYVWVDPTGTLRFRDMSAFPAPIVGLGCAPPGGGVIAAYDFEAVEWTLYDVGPSGAHDGTIIGSPTWSGGGLNFDGSTYVDVPPDPALDFTDDFRLSATIARRGLTGGRMSIVSKGNNTYQLSLSPDGRLELRHSAEGNAAMLTAPTALDESKHSVAGVKEGSFAALYVDGLEVARRTDAPGGIGSNPFPLTIGAHTYWDGVGKVDRFTGTIYELELRHGSETWLAGLADVIGRVAGDRIVNRVVASDAAGDPLPPWEDPVSLRLYGPREFSADRAVPTPDAWAAEILADRSDASYQLDVLELRPYDAAELGVVLRVNTAGPQEIRVRDDEHGPTLDLVTRTYGGELGVDPVGWHAVWVTGLREGQLPTLLEVLERTQSRPTPQLRRDAP